MDVMTGIAVLSLLWIFVMIFSLIYNRFHQEESIQTSSLIGLNIKESDYIKKQRELCISKNIDKLIITNPNLKVDWRSGPTVLSKVKSC